MTRLIEIAPNEWLDAEDVWRVLDVTGSDIVDDPRRTTLIMTNGKIRFLTEYSVSEIVSRVNRTRR